MNKKAIYSIVSGSVLCAAGYLFANVHYRTNDDLVGSALIIVGFSIFGLLIAVCGSVYFIAAEKEKNKNKQQ